MIIDVSTHLKQLLP